MSPTTQLAKHVRAIYFEENWTCSNLKDNLTGVTWQEATTQVQAFNTILALVYHMHYYVRVAMKVLEGGSLDGHDKFSFDHPPIRSQQEWERFVEAIWSEAERFAQLVEALPETQLWEDFADKKYGNYYRNIQGIIEHSYYHLGQIALIKKMFKQA